LACSDTRATVALKNHLVALLQKLTALHLQNALNQPAVLQLRQAAVLLPSQPAVLLLLAATKVAMTVALYRKWVDCSLRSKTSSRETRAVATDAVAIQAAVHQLRQAAVLQLRQAALLLLSQAAVLQLKLTALLLQAATK
jgi:hypothetical protein